MRASAIRRSCRVACSCAARWPAHWSPSPGCCSSTSRSLREAVFLAQRTVMFSRRPAHVVANRPIDLPDDRAAELRTSVAYNEIVERLYQDLLIAEGGA